MSDVWPYTSPTKYFGQILWPNTSAFVRSLEKMHNIKNFLYYLLWSSFARSLANLLQPPWDWVSPQWSPLDFQKLSKLRFGRKEILKRERKYRKCKYISGYIYAPHFCTLHWTATETLFKVIFRNGRDNSLNLIFWN